MTMPSVLKSGAEHASVPINLSPFATVSSYDEGGKLGRLTSPAETSPTRLIVVDAPPVLDDVGPAGPPLQPKDTTAMARNPLGRRRELMVMGARIIGARPPGVKLTVDNSYSSTCVQARVDLSRITPLNQVSPPDSEVLHHLASVCDLNFHRRVDELLEHRPVLEIGRREVGHGRQQVVAGRQVAEQVSSGG